MLSTNETLLRLSATRVGDSRKDSGCMTSGSSAGAGRGMNPGWPLASRTSLGAAEEAGGRDGGEYKGRHTAVGAVYGGGCASTKSGQGTETRKGGRNEED